MENFYYFAIVITALIIALIVRKYFVFVTLISSYSMHPSIKPGDRILTLRIYKFQKIKRGDVLVFHSKELNNLFIKRVIGLPNEVIEIIDRGTVYVNQKKLDEPYVKQTGGLDGKFKVPENSFLLLGDNRYLSIDSRNWENPFITDKDVLGKALISICPFHLIKVL